MTFYVTDQNRVVFALFLFGIFCGFMRDIITVKRKVIGTVIFTEIPEDIIYCALMTFLYFMVIFVTNYGYVRWYEFASLSAGFALYRLTLSGIVVRMLSFVLEKLLKITGAVLKFVLSPMVFLARLLKKRIFIVVAFCSEKEMRRRSEAVLKRHLKKAENGFC